METVRQRWFGTWWLRRSRPVILRDDEGWLEATYHFRGVEWLGWRVGVLRFDGLHERPTYPPQTDA